MFKGWRTIIFNALFGIVPVLDIAGQVFSVPEIQAVVPDDYLKYYLLTGALINLGLRTITNTAVGKK